MNQYKISQNRAEFIDRLMSKQQMIINDMQSGSISAYTAKTAKPRLLNDAPADKGGMSSRDSPPAGFLSGIARDGAADVSPLADGATAKTQKSGLPSEPLIKGGETGNGASEEGLTPSVGRLKSIWRSSLTGTVLYTLMAFIVIVTFIKYSADNVPRDFFGFSGMIVLTRSMQSEIPQGSFILVKQTDPSELQVGDDITYLRSADVTFTHRIVSIYENYHDMKRGFQTKGVDNGAPDDEIVTADNVVGKVIFHSYVLGRLFNFVNSNLLISAILIMLIPELVIALRLIFPSSKKTASNKQKAGNYFGNSK